MTIYQEYEYGLPFTSDELSVKYVNLRYPFKDTKYDKEFFKIVIHCNYDRETNENKKSFLKILHRVLSAKRDFIAPKTGTEYIEKALTEGIIYKKNINNDNIYYLTAEQRTNFLFKKDGINQIANFYIPVFNKNGEKFKQDDIPFLDDKNYNNKAEVTMKTKIQKSSGRIFIDLVAVKLTDYKEYKTDNSDENFIDNKIDDVDFDNLDVGKEDMSLYDPVFNEYEDDIPF